MIDALDANVSTRYIVVDLEATCWAESPPAQSETIEIGAVAYEVGKGVLDEFQMFLRPRLQPALSGFCMDLTAIRQADVDTAPLFPEAYGKFHRWAEAFLPYTFASWGSYDRKQLQQDCDLHGIPYTCDSHVDLKATFSDVMGCRRCGMVRALQKLGIPLRGTHRRGIDDARNMTRILGCLLAVDREPYRGWD